MANIYGSGPGILVILICLSEVLVDAITSYTCKCYLFIYFFFHRHRTVSHIYMYYFPFANPGAV